jgi:membrane-associated phospholipid phosphatase
MKTNTSWKRLVIVVALGVALLGVPVHPAVGEALAAMTLSELSDGPATVTALSGQATDSVMEWNTQAVGQTVLPASALDPANQVLEWNQIFIDTLIATNTVNSSSPRLGAIVHTAIFDAYNGIKRRYTPIFVQHRGPKGSSRRAAVIAAAYTALVGLFPSRQSALEASYEASLAALSDDGRDGGESRERGIAWGTEVAQAVLAWRATDGFSASYPPFTGGAAVGQWRPTPPAFGAMSAQVLAFTAMFVLDSDTQFTPVPPRGLTSPTYTDDFNAVKALGRKTGSTRTEDQTALAVFWEGNASVHWNQAANQIALANHLSISESNRLFAVLNIAMADTVITTFNSKRFYGDVPNEVTWRPLTAITLADADGNPDTASDPDWLPLINTPSHPEYPAGHPSLNGAAATVLLRHFRRRQTFTLTTIGQPSRTYTSITQARSDGNNARVWGGMHYPSTVVISDAEGEAIANYVNRKSMQLR